MVSIRHPLDDDERFWRDRMFDHCQNFGHAVDDCIRAQV